MDYHQTHLSPREQQTLQLLLTGAAQKGIAESLGVSLNTAHEYVKAVYRKLRVKSRAELMARALSSLGVRSTHPVPGN